MTSPLPTSRELTGVTTAAAPTRMPGLMLFDSMGTTRHQCSSDPRPNNPNSTTPPTATLASTCRMMAGRAWRLRLVGQSGNILVTSAPLRGRGLSVLADGATPALLRTGCPLGRGEGVLHGRRLRLQRVAGRRRESELDPEVVSAPGSERQVAQRHVRLDPR